MNDLSGQNLGRYHLIKKLGEGGMAVVYKAFDTRLECEVAVKVIRMERLAPEIVETTMKRFEREAKAVAQLSHPNIVNVTDYGEHEGVPYLVMKYLPGGTLKQMLGKPVAFAEAARLLAPVADALQYAHTHKIVHRDIKPSNILIAETGAPVLTDFGIAKLLDVEEGQTLTGTGVGVGTPEYMAPEQGLGQAVDGRADIYSLGIVFYELVTGHKPYTADTPLAVLLKQVNDPLPQPGSLIAGLPAEVDRVIFKSLAKKPEDRYQSMSEFAAALKRLAQEETIRHEEPVPNITSSAEESDTLATRDELEVGPVLKAPPVLMNPPVRTIEPKEVPASPKKKWQSWQIVAGGLAVVALVILAIGAGNGWFAVQVTPTVPPMAEGITTPTNSAQITLFPTETSLPIPAATPALGIGSTQVSSVDGMMMVYVPAGSFTMGDTADEAMVECQKYRNDCEKNWFTDEEPVHTVILSSYWIDQTEVTNAMYEKCVNAGTCTVPMSNSSYTHKSYYGNSAYDDYPIINVNWNQAQTYCKWAGRELPTEAQWEKAARGANGQIYPWGNDSPGTTLANYNDNMGDTTKVSIYLAGASPYGALDMAGNVWEWVADWYDADYYSNSSIEDPAGPASGQYRVRRGGSWMDPVYNIRSAVRRIAYDPSISSELAGFRCALSADAPQ